MWKSGQRGKTDFVKIEYDRHSRPPAWTVSLSEGCQNLCQLTSAYVTHSRALSFYDVLWLIHLPTDAHIGVNDSPMTLGLSGASCTGTSRLKSPELCQKTATFREDVTSAGEHKRGRSGTRTKYARVGEGPDATSGSLPTPIA